MKNGLAYAVKLLFRLTYSLLVMLFPVNQRKVVIASYREEKMSDNFKWVHDQLSQDSSLHFTLLFKKMDSGLLGKFKYFCHLLSALYHIATCRILLLDDYYFPLYVIKKRKETISIQLWHACGAFKKFGYSLKDKPSGPSSAYLKIVPVHSNYDYAIVSSPAAVSHFSEAFHMPEERVLSLGVPRTDYFYHKARLHSLKTDFEKTYPSLKGKKKLLYAPTFRGSGHDQVNESLPLNLDELKQALNQDDYVVMIHLHPYLRHHLQIKKDDFVIDFGDQYSLYDLMALSDALITDYSSVIFEYSILQRPIYFYCPDLEDYLKERDFYYPFESFVPGPISKSVTALAEDITRFQNPDMKKIKDFSNTFIVHQDGQSSKRVADFVQSFMTRTNEEKERYNREEVSEKSEEQNIPQKKQS
ncbi:CDP-glycerol glycerophosphotransferase family protein [Bacillus changyiensis]|uniref:CDP-glycerol glycerophosphotransferase family protein n=1 Tax=Bacillus changyiensis TaxID=3004103 RepID=UPI0022E08352|nr:CDP-glycerol glycerophosphotransferase family protein [Bacillus changyiensis]MDA1476606.1 CDP-glycerol glycerophosphotransferase family protein [Bacillus changyiensis]